MSLDHPTWGSSRSRSMMTAAHDVGSGARGKPPSRDSGARTNQHEDTYARLCGADLDDNALYTRMMYWGESGGDGTSAPVGGRDGARRRTYGDEQAGSVDMEGDIVNVIAIHRGHHDRLADREAPVRRMNLERGTPTEAERWTAYGRGRRLYQPGPQTWCLQPAHARRTPERQAGWTCHQEGGTTTRAGSRTTNTTASDLGKPGRAVAQTGVPRGILAETTRLTPVTGM
jgi:hypothetical protein